MIPSRQAGTPTLSTHPPAGWGRLGISCLVGVIEASPKEDECRTGREEKGKVTV